MEKKPYSPPKLKIYGNIEDLTQSVINKTPGVGDTIRIVNVVISVPGSSVI